jgi:hypothetical protein
VVSVALARPEADAQSVAAWRLLLADVAPHANDDGVLGEYAVQLQHAGPAAAAAAFPEVARHLERACATCVAMVQAASALLAWDESPPGMLPHQRMDP